MPWDTHLPVRMQWSAASEHTTIRYVAFIDRLFQGENISEEEDFNRAVEQ